MPTLSAAARRELLPLLKDILEKGMCVGMETRIESAIARYSKKPKPIPQRKKDKAARKLSLKAQTAAIRGGVFKRAGGLCEACRNPDTDLELDHWLSGSGRRREKQSVETCWALCYECHRERTENRPTAFHWNLVFEQHCKRYDYPFIPHVEHAIASAPKEPPKAV